MIAFYACTNTQIINMINVKVQYYQNERADLYILKKNRVDLELIKCIEESNVFETIVFIEPYVLPRNMILKILSLVLLNNPGKYYKKLLAESIYKKIYNKFITFGFWADALYILRILCNKNPNIEVEFVEEGLVNYFPDDRELYFCRAYAGYKEKLIRLFVYGFRTMFENKRIKNIYVYKPQFIKNSKFELKEIHPKKIDKNHTLKNIIINYSNCIEDCIGLYKDIEYIYLLDNYRLDRHIALIKYYYQKCRNGNFIIKVHPENTDDDIKLIRDSFKNVIIDTSNFYFESIAIANDLKRCYIISRASSSAYVMNILFSSNHHNVLLYKLFDYKNYDGFVSDLDNFWESMNSVYGNIIIERRLTNE